jgi:hypothetical protein
MKTIQTEFGMIAIQQENGSNKISFDNCKFNSMFSLLSFLHTPEKEIEKLIN